MFNVHQNKNIDEDVEKLFDYFRANGFPNYLPEDYDSKRELEKLIAFDESTIYNDKELRQTMHSLGFLWTFFPHWIDVRYKTEKNTLRENWNDNSKLWALIRKTYIWQQKYGRGKFTLNRLRQNAKVYCSKQSVSNFRPTAAKYIYNAYGNKGIVWDMSCGWGGRLMGFYSSDCEKYIGTEPSEKTFKGLQDLKDTYSYIDKAVELHMEGSENFSPEKNSIDLCFTSPPYFDTEQYASEETQSFKAHPTKELWSENFLGKTIENCYNALKADGYMIINIADTPKEKWIEDETMVQAAKYGFVHVDTNYLVLSSIAGKGKKLEPIFIFKK